MSHVGVIAQEGGIIGQVWHLLHGHLFEPQEMKDFIVYSSQKKMEDFFFPRC
jgi:hypothetical protein